MSFGLHSHCQGHRGCVPHSLTGGGRNDEGQGNRRGKNGCGGRVNVFVKRGLPPDLEVKDEGGVTSFVTVTLYLPGVVGPTLSVAGNHALPAVAQPTDRKKRDKKRDYDNKRDNKRDYDILSVCSAM
jgi:hypothetical protein